MTRATLLLALLALLAGCLLPAPQPVIPSAPYADVALVHSGGQWVLAGHSHVEPWVQLDVGPDFACEGCAALYQTHVTRDQFLHDLLVKQQQRLAQEVSAVLQNQQRQIGEQAASIAMLTSRLDAMEGP